MLLSLWKNSCVFPVYVIVLVLLLCRATTTAQVSDTDIKTLCQPKFNDVLDLNNDDSLLSRLLVPRPPGSAALKSLQAQLVKEFSDLGWSIEMDTFTDSTPAGDFSFTNLIFTHNPNAHKRLILAAHLDSKYAPPNNPMSKFVGATDSAAPVALLVDVARALDSLLDNQADRGTKDETLQIVLFDGEEAFHTWTREDSIYGARHLAEKWWTEPLTVPSAAHPPVRSLSGISAFVLLDLLGAPHARIPAFFQQTQWLYDKFYSAQKRLNTLGMTTQQFFDGQLRHPQAEDDHLPFLVRGVPVVHIIPTPFPPVWHTLADNKSALDIDVLEAWSYILRVAVADHMSLIEKSRDEL